MRITDHLKRPDGASILVALLSIPTAGWSASAGGSEDEPAAWTGLDDTVAIVSQASAPAEDWLHSAVPILGQDLELAARARLYDGTHQPEDGEAIGVRVATIPLREPLDGGVLGVAVDPDGNVVTARLWGRQELDEDPLRSWSFFLSQFTRQPPLHTTIARSGTPTALEIGDYAQRVLGGELSSRQLALYRMRLLMRDNSYRFTVRFRSPAAHTPAWLEAWRDNFTQTAALASELEDLLGESTTRQFRESAKRGADLLTEAIDAAEHADDARVKRTTGQIYRQSCQSCHQLESEALGEGGIYFGLMHRLHELGIRGDLATVGVDVYALPDQPAEASQEVATALRAALLVLHAETSN